MAPADKPMFSPSNDRFLWKLKAAVPFRLSALHLAFPSEPVVAVERGMLDLLTLSDRVRTKLYTGGLTMETQYKLMTFGISALPVTCTGQIKNKFHIQWLKTRSAYESAQHVYPIMVRLNWIMIPEANDVLFRSGGGYSQHYGNLEFELIVESKLPAYCATKDRKVKRDIREEVVNAVRSRGGRFLEISKEHKCRWLEVADMDALQNKLYTFFYQHQKRLDIRAEHHTSISVTTSLVESKNKRRKLDNAKGYPKTSE
jgi:hypothetical protein